MLPSLTRPPLPGVPIRAIWQKSAQTSADSHESLHEQGICGVEYWERLGRLTRRDTKCATYVEAAYGRWNIEDITQVLERNIVKARHAYAAPQGISEQDVCAKIGVAQEEHTHDHQKNICAIDSTISIRTRLVVLHMGI